MACYTLHLAFLFGLLAGLLAEQDSSEKTQQDKKLLACLNCFSREYDPKDPVFQKEGIRWTIYSTTDVPQYRGVSCVTYDTNGGGKMTVTTDGEKSTVEVTEKGSQLSIKGNNDIHMKLVSNYSMGIYCGVTYPAKGPLPTRLNIGIVTTKWATEDNIAKVKTEVEKCGQKLCKVFNCKLK